MAFSLNRCRFLQVSLNGLVGLTPGIGLAADAAKEGELLHNGIRLPSPCR